MSDEPLSQCEIILSEAEDGLKQTATCKDDLQVRAAGYRAVMMQIEHDTIPEDSHA